MERPVGYRVTISVMDGFVFGLGMGLAVAVLYGLGALTRTLLAPLLGVIGH